MTSYFLDSATTKFFVASAVSGDPLLVSMPAVVDAGDTLIVVGSGGSITPSGWTAITTGAGRSWYRIADGTEGGTTVNFAFGGTVSNVRVHRAVLRYRFPAAFSTPVGNSNTWAFGDTSTFGTKHATHSFLDSIPIHYELRLHVITNTSANENYIDPVLGQIGAPRDAGPVAWTSDQPQALPTEVYHDEAAGSVGTIADVPSGTTNRRDLLVVAEQDRFKSSSVTASVDVTLSPDGGQVGDGYTIRLAFPTLDIPSCITVGEWGYYGPADGAPTTPGGGEASGFVEAGLNNLTFQATPVAGALLIAFASRWHMNSGSVPPTGVMSGFGATWDQIYSQSGSGQGSAGFSEVYRAQQASYTVPDRIRYTFPAGSTGDKIYSAVGWMSYLGTTPDGLSDNGASAIRNLTYQGPSSGATPASYSQGSMASFESPSNLWFNAWWQLADSSEPNFGFTWNGTPVAPSSGWPSSQRATVPPQPQWDVNEGIHTRRAGEVATWTWELGYNRSWWACTFEIRADPSCAGVVLFPYWGILTRPG